MCIVSANLFIYLSIYLSICISIYRYLCAYIFIYHSIYLSLYIITIKWYCFQTEQLKLCQKQNILYFENNFILCSIYILIDILWHQFTLSPLNDKFFRLSIVEGLEKTETHSILKTFLFYCRIWILIF